MGSRSGGCSSSCDPVYTEWNSERGESSACPQEDNTTKRGGDFHEQRQHRVAAAPPHMAAWTSLGGGRSSYGSALTSCCHIQVQINDTWGTSLCRAYLRGMADAPVKNTWVVVGVLPSVIGQNLVNVPKQPVW